MDPARRADAADVVWSWRHDPSLAILAAAPPDGDGGITLESLGPVGDLRAPEGRHVALSAAGGVSRALVVGGADDDAPLAAVVPLDGLAEERIDAALRLCRAVARGEPPAAPDRFTKQRRARLKLVLRALDAHLEGLGYRGIARRLFGGRVPDDAAWKTHSLRSFTIRLVAEGLALMRGGYLRLLRPDRRRRKGPPDGMPDSGK